MSKTRVVYASRTHLSLKKRMTEREMRAPTKQVRRRNVKGPADDAIGSLFNNEVAWDQGETNDIWFIIHRISAAVDRMEAFRSMTMCKPFRLFIGKLHAPRKTWRHAPMQPMMQDIVQTNFMDFLYDVTLWISCFGICPYFLEPITGTVHFRPWVPVFGSGYITTYMDEKTHKQRFRWWWSHGKSGKDNVDESVGWITDGKQPLLSGGLRSPMSSVLETYRHTIYGMRDNQHASYHSTHPSAVVTHDPKTQALEDEAIIGGIFSEAIAKEIAYEDEEAALEKHSFQATSLARAFQEAGIAQDVSASNMRYTEGSVMQSESSGRQYGREHNGYYDSRVVVPPNFNIARGPDYRTTINVIEWDAILANKICEVLGIPSEMDKSSTGQKSANKEGIKMSMGERLKRRTKWIERVAEHIFLDIYGETLQRGFDTYLNTNGTRYNRPRVNTRKRGNTTLNEMALDSILNAYVDVRIELHCSPLLNEAMALELYDRDFFDEEYFNTYLTDKYGFPETAIKRIKNGERRKPKDPAFELQEQQQTFQQQMGEREMKLKEKAQKEDMALKRKIQQDKFTLEQDKLTLQKKQMVQKGKEAAPSATKVNKTAPTPSKKRKVADVEKDVA